MRHVHYIVLLLALFFTPGSIANAAEKEVEEQSQTSDDQKEDDKNSAEKNENATTPDSAGSNNKDADKNAEVLPAVATLNDKFKGIKNPAKSMTQVTKVGECLTYAIKYEVLSRMVRAGTAKLQVKRKRRLRGNIALEAELNYVSNKVVSLIYPVNSSVETMFDVKTGESRLFKRRLRERRINKRKVDDRLEFHQKLSWPDGRVAPASVYQKVKENKTKVSSPRPIPGPVQDSLSVIYYLRNFKFNKVGDNYDFLVANRKNVSIVNIKAIEFDEVTVPGIGKVEAVVIESKGDDRVDSAALISADGAPKIWLEKNSLIPLRITVKISNHGKAELHLIQAENTDLDKYIIKDKKEEEK